MYRFNISAPGVVFLNGDPIPKYNQTAIAAGLNMRTKLTFSSVLPNAVKKNFIELNFPNIQLHMKIPLLAYFHLFNIIKSTNKDLTICREVRKFVSTLVYTGMYNSDNRDHFSSLQAFFSLLVLIAHRHSINITTSFVVEISSELPIGEGLGSSASFLVCLATCFLRWSLLQKGISSYEFDSEERLRIMHYCSICEGFIFHSSSSISISVCIKGAIVIYGKTTEGLYVDWIYHDYPSIKILLVCSNAKWKIVQNRKFDIIRHLYSFIQPIMNIIDELSKTFVEMLSNWKIDQDMRKLFQNVDELEPSKLKDHYEKLLDLILLNQGLLSALGASHPFVDIICAIAQNYSLRGKMTYRGRCGYVFIVLPPNFMDNDLSRLIIELESYDFSATVTNLCGKWNGVRVE
ncbi:hypothetical protein P5V15_003881 [Pogonomyrmex californicus]